MKYGQRDVLELHVYDENGNLVANLNTLQDSGLYLNQGAPFVFVKDALLNMDLMKFIGKEERANTSDYEKTLGKMKYETTIVFNQFPKKKCKLIGKGLLRKNDTKEDVEFLFEVPNAQITKWIDWKQSKTEVTEFDLFFEMLPYNDNRDLYKFHI